MFRNREDAGRLLAERLRGPAFRDPLVLAIPRGGVVVGAMLARELGADLDVALVRKLRAPGQPELAVGAISATGETYLQPNAKELPELVQRYLPEERRRQLAELLQRKRLLRRIRPAAPIAGRSVIVTDDGLATGSTMIAALLTIRSQQPFEVIVAVPVAAPGRIDEVRRYCDEVVCLSRPEDFWAVGQFYRDFEPVEDWQVVELLREFAPHGGRKENAPAREAPVPMEGVSP
jgi:hypothetical protein